MFNIHGDERGSLLPIEFAKDLNFSPKRCFVVTDVPRDMERGGHAHWHTQQLLICVKGKINCTLDYGNYNKKSTMLNPGDSIEVPPLVWDTQDFLTGDDVLLVMCSTEYEKSDYILDYDEFTHIINGIEYDSERY
tara:strand:+ start:3725 stop:4129 length:405 start_codon:yes stop_codon:yes gene_type:complete